MRRCLLKVLDGLVLGALGDGLGEKLERSV
jgi:hypothetical protein